MKLKSALEIKQLFSSDQEVAFIDIREAAQYGAGHPFLSPTCLIVFWKAEF